jgi:hypothetical protein
MTALPGKTSGQRLNDFTICLGKGKLPELIPVGPTPIRTLKRLWRTAHMDAPKGVKRNAKMRVRMFHRHDSSANFNVNTNFFERLTGKTLFEAFTFFLFAPRKLPKPSQKTLPRSLDNQDPAGFILDYSCSHMMVPHWSPFFQHRESCLQPLDVRLAILMDRAVCTSGMFRGADGSA